MAQPHEKLAASLAILKEVQDQTGLVVEVKSHPRLTRRHRERLKANGFLTPVIAGWYIASRPNEVPGESTSWYTSMDAFVAAYATSRFGDRWQVCAELSLLRHSGESSAVRQITIHSPQTSNHPVQLLHGCSLFLYKVVDATMSTGARPSPSGLRLLPLEEALVAVSPQLFKTQVLACQISLRSADTTELTRVLLAGGMSVVAGRMAGGLRAVGRAEDANSLLAAMRAAGYKVQVISPFESALATISGSRQEPPAVQRIRAMWSRMRPAVVRCFGQVPRSDISDVQAFLADIESRYVTDAYHSLSIEGYQVNDELIEKVRAGDWNPEGNANDRDLRNAMAAKGYFELHRHVLALIASTLASGANQGDALRRDFPAWYLALFSPSVQAGIVEASALAGYRNSMVIIRNARHVPPGPQGVRDSMPVLMEMLTDEPDVAVRAVLGHFIFVYIHPYMDGNGRLARFLMNFMLCTAGYHWTIVTMHRRSDYMAALEQASTHGNIDDFAQLLAALVAEQRDHPVERATQQSG